MTVSYLKSIVFACGLLGGISFAWGQDSHTSKPIPANRAEMLKSLEALKQRQPRLPLQPLDEAALEAVPAAPAPPGTPGSLGVVNNGRMRSQYLPAELQSRGAQPPANNNQLPYDFSTELFWIVSRVNNCHYCLGHQESKLKAVGVNEDTLLALDTDWSSFPENHRVAFAFARQLTLAPYSVNDQNVDALRPHFTDSQILEIAFLVGRYNSTNRWTDSLGIPQEDHRDYLSSLKDDQTSIPSTVAVQGFPERKVFSDFGTWNAAFEKQASRKPRLTSEASNPGSESAHASLLASIPAAGDTWIEQLRAAEKVGKLSTLLRHKIAYVAARSDHAWYMQHVSRTRLLADGLSDEAIFSLFAVADRASTDTSADAKDNLADRIAITFARKLTEDPQSMTDADINALKKHFSDYEVAEIVYHTGLAALLNRLTEVAQLGW
jgi:alkylhydroperoxidase family enzyme